MFGRRKFSSEQGAYCRTRPPQLSGYPERIPDFRATSPDGRRRHTEHGHRQADSISASQVATNDRTPALTSGLADAIGQQLDRLGDVGGNGGCNQQTDRFRGHRGQVTQRCRRRPVSDFLE